MSAAEWKFQQRHNDRLLRRLELPERDSAGAFVFLLCVGGALAALVLGAVLS